MFKEPLPNPPNKGEGARRTPCRPCGYQGVMMEIQSVTPNANSLPPPCGEGWGGVF